MRISLLSDLSWGIIMTIPAQEMYGDNFRVIFFQQLRCYRKYRLVSSN